MRRTRKQRLWYRINSNAYCSKASKYLGTIVLTTAVLLGELDPASEARGTTAETTIELCINDPSQECILVATYNLLVPTENVLELVHLLGRKHAEDFGLGTVRFRDFGLDLLGLGSIFILLGELLYRSLDLVNDIGGTLGKCLTAVGVDLLPATLLLEEGDDFGGLLLVVQDTLVGVVLENAFHEALHSLTLRLQFAGKGKALYMMPFLHTCIGTGKLRKYEWYEYGTSNGVSRDPIKIIFTATE